MFNIFYRLYLKRHIFLNRSDVSFFIADLAYQYQYLRFFLLLGLKAKIASRAIINIETIFKISDT